MLSEAGDHPHPISETTIRKINAEMSFATAVGIQVPRYFLKECIIMVLNFILISSLLVIRVRRHVVSKPLF